MGHTSSLVIFRKMHITEGYIYIYMYFFLIGLNFYTGHLNKNPFRGCGDYFETKIAQVNSYTSCKEFLVKHLGVEGIVV